ncbi:hypothetical protein E0W72_00910 [Flavobacterium arcticum]|nr:hypothetical protein [Flavobacterium arcticum]KAF2513014.1 hypothetical protein E0W72_00910 [Flavobacterium arcticum]
MNRIIVLFCLLLTFSAFSQKKLSDYKYMIVPERFEFQKATGEYNLNQLTKGIFEKKGFTVFLSSDILPENLAFDRCKLLYANVQEESSMFKTELTITVKDCSGKVLFATEKGVSKEKEIQRAYYEALREASRWVDTMVYDYNGNTQAKVATNTAEFKTDANVDESTLFAQPIKNGYQLVDSAPKVVLKMYKTSHPDYYIGITEGKNGMILKDDGNWFFEYYQDNELIIEKLNIKF